MNYGYNKISYIEKLKYVIEQFFIVAHAFAVDLPHPKYSLCNFLIHKIYISRRVQRSHERQGFARDALFVYKGTR